MTHLTVTVARGEMAHTVLRRLARAVGATADLTVDRLEDATLVCEVLMERFDGDDHATVRFVVRDDGLEIVFIGVPEGQGTAASTAVLPGLGPMITRLADDVWIEPDGGPDREHVHVLVGRSVAA